jgi:hypothetical protein
VLGAGAHSFAAARHRAGGGGPMGFGRPEHLGAWWHEVVELRVGLTSQWSCRLGSSGDSGRQGSGGVGGQSG